MSCEAREQGVRAGSFLQQSVIDFITWPEILQQYLVFHRHLVVARFDIREARERGRFGLEVGEVDDVCDVDVWSDEEMDQVRRSECLL